MQYELEFGDLSDHDNHFPLSTFPVDPNLSQLNELTPPSVMEPLTQAQSSESEDDEYNLKESKAPSWIWTHGTRVKEDRKQYWKCSYCKRFVQ